MVHCAGLEGVALGSGMKEEDEEGLDEMEEGQLTCVAKQGMELDGPEHRSVSDLGSANRLSLLTSGCTDQIISLSMTS